MTYKIGSYKSELLFSDDINKYLKLDNSVFIVDRKVADIYKFNLGKHFLFDAFEENKSYKILNELYEFFYKNQVNRNTNIIGIGGGITLDIAGYAAATYKRGCKFISIPTTLLAQVDAAIGGKTAINFHNIKNLIGTFYPAELIIINTSFIKTLPKKELLNGYAEILKTALIDNNGVLNSLNNFKIDRLLIKKTIESKIKICEKDPFDKNIRRFLNFGHTFAHIIETISNYKISHGKAVAIGILTASYLSYKMRYLPIEDFEIIKNHLQKFDLDEIVKYQDKLENIKDEIIISDKKNDSNINLVLLSSLFNPFIYKTNKTAPIKTAINETIEMITTNRSYR